VATSKVGIWNLALINIGQTQFIESESERSLAADVCGRVWDNCLRRTLEAKDWLFARRQASLSRVDSQTASYTGDGSETSFSLPSTYVNSSAITVTVDDVEQTLDTDYTITNLTLPGSVDYVDFTSAPANGATVRITQAVSRVGWDYLYGLPADVVTPLEVLYTNTRISLTGPHNQIRWALMLNDAQEGYYFAVDRDLGQTDGIEYVALVQNTSVYSESFVRALAWCMAEPLARALAADDRRATQAAKMYAMAIETAAAYDFNRTGSSPVHESVTPSLAARGDGLSRWGE